MLVDEIETCVCGHAPEEHGDDPAFAGSTACRAKDCDCVAFEADAVDESEG